MCVSFTWKTKALTICTLHNLSVKAWPGIWSGQPNGSGPQKVVPYFNTKIRNQLYLCLYMHKTQYIEVASIVDAIFSCTRYVFFICIILLSAKSFHGFNNILICKYDGVTSRQLISSAWPSFIFSYTVFFYLSNTRNNEYCWA